MHRLTLLLLLPLALASTTGCAEDIEPPDDPGDPGAPGNPGDDPGDPGDDPGDDPPPSRITSTDNGDGSTTTVADATASDAWVYFDFDAAGEAAPAQPEASADWDLGFQRFSIKLNGGASGSGGMELAALPGADFDAMGAAPASGYVTDVPEALAFLTAEGGWFDYDPVTHVLTPKGLLYVVRSVEGDHYKLEILDYYDDAGTGGFVAFRWAPIAGTEGP